jgi:membrane fusion protein, multidrug efflux system
LQLVSVGNIVTPQDPRAIATIAQVQPIAALFPFPSADLPEIQQALSTAGSSGLAVEAWSQSGRYKLDTGSLEAIDNQISASSGTVMMKAIFPNLARRLWPGEFINLKIILRTKPNALTVPLGAIERGPSGTFVWALTPEGTAHQASVTVAASTNGQAIIGAGLAPGGRVVTDGQFGLVEGSHTEIMKAGTVSQNGTTIQNSGDNQLGISP